MPVSNNLAAQNADSSVEQEAYCQRVRYGEAEKHSTRNFPRLKVKLDEGNVDKTSYEGRQSRHTPNVFCVLLLRSSCKSELLSISRYRLSTERVLPASTSYHRMPVLRSMPFPELPRIFEITLVDILCPPYCTLAVGSQRYCPVAHSKLALHLTLYSHM